MPRKITLSKSPSLTGELTVPGDKSISHRAVMLGSLAEGTTEITGFLAGADCLSTIDCFRRLGVRIETGPSDGTVHIFGKGMRALNPSGGEARLYTGNSGTTTRIISGILAPQPFTTVLSGDPSVSARPMRRIMAPLREMGASIESINGNDCAPLRITGSPLHGINWHSTVASAQVKSAILCAGLYADGETSVVEPALSRDHTERMLRAFGADVSSCQAADGWQASVKPCGKLTACAVNVPGDISSAAFFIAAALLVPGSELLIRNVGCNPTRAGILQILEQMGARIETVSSGDPTEPSADLLVRHSDLKGTSIEGSVIPALIDELPVLAVLAAFADGTTIIRDAAELRVKESDRIEAVSSNLLAMGADVTPTEDGMIIRGGRPLHGAQIRTFGDHRVAMSFAVAALAAEGETTLDDSQCVEISYPSFWHDLQKLSAGVPLY